MEKQTVLWDNAGNLFLFGAILLCIEETRLVELNVPFLALQKYNLQSVISKLLYFVIVGHKR